MSGVRAVRVECIDCVARIGDPHERGCDVARCLWTGFQRLACPGSGHAVDYVNGVPVKVELEDGHDCGRDAWSGWWPGELEAAALGLWCYWDAGWKACGPDHPGGSPDLNRLVTECRWDRERHQWLRGAAPLGIRR